MRSKALLAIVAVAIVGLAGCCCSQKPHWKLVAEGQDCTGTDVACTMKSSAPDPGLCNADAKGKTAVCWDGSKYTGSTECFNASAWCTYKTTPAQSCVGGGIKGVVYECK